MEDKDVIGKEGSERPRFDLLNVINFAIAPVKAHTVLFKGLTIQSPRRPRLNAPRCTPGP